MSDLLLGVPMDYEPKTKNRFFLEFPDDVGIEIWKVQKFDRPKLDIDNVEIQWFHETQYFSNKYKWQALTITLLDVIAPSTGQQVMEWVRQHAESITGRMGYAQGYKKNLILKATDPTGVSIEKWSLEQCNITSVDFQDNDMESNEAQKITITIQPQRCILNA